MPGRSLGYPVTGGPGGFFFGARVQKGNRAPIGELVCNQERRAGEQEEGALLLSRGHICWALDTGPEAEICR